MKMQIRIQEAWVGPEVCISAWLPGGDFATTFPRTTSARQGSSAHLSFGWKDKP